MERYCNRTGLPFQESMLTWSPGVIPDCQMWHENVIKSSVFEEPKARNLAKELREAVEYCMPFYEAIYSARMKLHHS